MLPEPPEDDVVRPELLEALAPLQQTNPVGRQADHIELYLDKATDLSEKEIFGVVAATQQSLTVTEQMYVQSTLALMRYAQR